ncbi:c-type cytochrome [Mariprofundus ferrooxydans]|nr:c-type cytochrome [Mariprofundus ferrooxydans]
MLRLTRSLSVVAAAFVLLYSTSAAAGSFAGFKVIEKMQCATCHNLSGEVGLKTAGLWRKGPDLYYAGNKYRENWVSKWLQNPKRIRPAGIYYFDHVESGKKMDMIRKTSFEDHIRLNAKDAKNVALALAEMRGKNALVRTEKYDSEITAGALGELMFDKVNGCMACHRIDADYGGLSGPEIFTAGERLKPEFMLSYVRDPQAWDHNSMMPAREMTEEDRQKLVNYMISLSKTKNIDEGKITSLDSAAKNYRYYCMQCHGIAGHGSGVNARDMAVPPRNHSDGVYLKARSDAELFKVIKEGGAAVNKSALMPPWKGTLTDSEIHEMVKHVRRLCKCKYEAK